MKATKIADGAYFVPSYSEQTIVRAYNTETTIQSFGYGMEDHQVVEEKEPTPPALSPGHFPALPRGR
jgi:hypothetical protein